MRTMTHHGRGKGAGGKAFGSKHNDRNFDLQVAQNIDPALTSENQYWNIHEGMTFEDAELRFYEEHFSEQLQQTNDKYRANGHPERCKDMAEWKKIRRNAPEESIFQIGDKHNTGVHADAATLLACYDEFAEFEQAWNEEHGSPFTVLNEALHVDEPECPPHIHSKKIWHYAAEDRSLRIGQERALELAGVELPHPDKDPGRYNNRKMTYDAMMREKWLDICEAHGLQIEREPLPDGKGKKSKDKEEYIRDKHEAMLQQASAAEKVAAFQHQLADAEAERAVKARQEAEKAEDELKEMCRIKTLAERDQVASDAQGELDQLQSAFDMVDNFCAAAEADMEYGGFNLRNLMQDFVFEWRRLRERIVSLVDSIKEKIRSIGIFERLQKVRPEEQVAPVLQESLDKTLAGATSRAGTGSLRADIEQDLPGDFE